jgi:CHAD domain-containing protein
MHPAEFSILLHRALEVRLGRLFELAADGSWRQDPDRLHEVRVASRRVRAVLELVDPSIYPGFKRHSRRLKALTQALGATRELDVHLAILDSLKSQDLESTHQAALEHAQEVLDRSRRRDRRRMAGKLSKIGLAECAGLLQVPNLPNPFAPGELRDAVWSCLGPRFEAAIGPLPGLVDEDVVTLHDLRIRIKKLRYTLEILAPGLSQDAGPSLERLRKLQTILGDHHDLATLEARLWELHSRLTERGRTILATGLLDIIGLAAENRRAAFDRFRQFAPTLTLESLVAALRASDPESSGAP